MLNICGTEGVYIPQNECGCPETDCCETMGAMIHLSVKTGNVGTTKQIVQYNWEVDGIMHAATDGWLTPKRSGSYIGIVFLTSDGFSDTGHHYLSCHFRDYFEGELQDEFYVGRSSRLSHAADGWTPGLEPHLTFARDLVVGHNYQLIVDADYTTHPPVPVNFGWVQFVYVGNGGEES